MSSESPTRNVIESPIAALEAMKELFRRQATFGCEKIEAGWVIVVFDPGRSYADDSAGQPSEIINEEHLGRVLAARSQQREETR